MGEEIIELQVRGGEQRWFRKSAIIGVEPAAREDDFKQFAVLTFITGVRLEVVGRAREIVEKL